MQLPAHPAVALDNNGGGGGGGSGGGGGGGALPSKAPTPLADCNSALAQLTKDLNAQDKRAGNERCEMVRQALENILGELTFLRLYRATRLAKQRCGGGTADTATVRRLVSALEDMWGAKTSPRDGATADTVVDRMLGLIGMEDAIAIGS